MSRKLVVFRSMYLFLCNVNEHLIWDVACEPRYDCDTETCDKCCMWTSIWLWDMWEIDYFSVYLLSPDMQQNIERGVTFTFTYTRTYITFRYTGTFKRLSLNHAECQLVYQKCHTWQNISSSVLQFDTHTRRKVTRQWLTQFVICLQGYTTMELRLRVPKTKFPSLLPGTTPATPSSLWYIHIHVDNSQPHESHCPIFI